MTWAEEGTGYWTVEHAGEVVGTAGLRHVLRARPWNLYYRLSPHIEGLDADGFTTFARDW